MKETLKTIAARTGFSEATVSRVLSGKAEKYRISKTTAEAVITDARLCNYNTSSIAQTLRTSASNTIGLLIPSISNPYFAEMAGVILTEVRRMGCTTIIIDTMENERLFRDSADLLLSRNVDGILAVPCGSDSKHLSDIDKTRLPVVLIDRYYEGCDLPYVTCNNYKGGLLATQSLISHGHSNIVCIQGNVFSTPNRDRVKGYRTAMSEGGFADHISIVGNEFSIQNGYLETRLLLESDNTPTALFTLSNTITLGAIKAIRESGLKIPRDISLISFDNYTYMDYMEPAISRISQPVEDMSKLAVKLLFNRIDSYVPGDRSTTSAVSRLKLSPTLINGESIATI